jgi:hypothetical protein
VPSIKCSSCGHRMLRPNATQTCTNCGAPLLPPELMEDEQQQSLVLYTPSQRSPDSALPTQTTEPHMALQSYPSSMSAQQIVPAQQQITSMNPFDASDASVPAIFTGSAEVEVPLVAPQFWDSESLPRGFPKRPPDISGTLVFVQSQLENRRTDNSFSKALIDAIWPTPNEPSSNKEKQVNVTTLRIRTNNGLQQDARMEGYLKGANISLGDTISLWGRKYKGTLVVYRGYNHTSKSVVMTSTMTSPLPVLFFILVIVGLLFFLSSFLHIQLLPNLSQFIH